MKWIQIEEKLLPSYRPSSAGKTAPIDMDPRKEHNKVRMQLAGGNSNKDRSPYGTPKGGRSPLLSPLVGNAAQVKWPETHGLCLRQCRACCTSLLGNYQFTWSNTFLSNDATLLRLAFLKIA